MEFLINRSYLQEKLSLVSRAISAHSPIPALSGVLFQLTDEGMTMTGSGSDFIIQTYFTPDEANQMRILEAGDFIVEARVLGELLRRMTGPMVQINTLEGDGSVMRLHGNDGNFDLVGSDAADYPAFNLDRPDRCVTLPVKVLREIDEQIRYAASQKDIRPILTGINLEAKDGMLAATATDSYRLARKVIGGIETEPFTITIPASPYAETVKSLGDAEMVDLYYSNKKAQFVFDNTVIQTQLLEGKYPNAAGIIPTEFVSTLKVGARDIDGMLNRSTIYTSDLSSSGLIVPVRMELRADSVALQVLTSKIGSCKQELESADYQGSDLDVSFNAKLVLEALRGLKSESQIEFGFTGQLRPIRITNPDDPTLTMVVVPIRSN